MPNFPTLRRELTIGHLSLAIDTVADTEAMLDALIARGPDDPDYQDEVMPYWAELWHSALGLGEFLTRHQKMISGKEIVELGCGLGLPGIVASLLGGRVTFTDYVEEALDFARQNLEHNTDEASATFRVLDWRDPPADRQYELILAADVAYERRFFQPLYDCLQTLLAPGGEIWLTEPGRAIGREFIEGMEAVGFKTLEEDFIDIKLDQVQRSVRWLRLQR